MPVNLILGIILLAGAAAMLMRKPPRAKRKRTQRNRRAASLVVIALLLLAGPTAKQHLAPSHEPPTSQAKPAGGTTSQQPLAKLAQLNYSNDQEITINNNDPGFTKTELATNKGGWTRFSDLDSQNRVGVAEAMLNQRLMPHAERERLTWDPTGWHNKKVHGEWLYNRSHLIGYQLSGENNNPKNLMTGTRSLNSPLMQAHEDDIAAYLKQNANHFVRYEVQPVFRGNELLARGVAMRAQSIGDNTIHFNVYIFNVEAGVTLNYADGTSHLN
ncbi:DNA/RNA non-specific endonuclease [Lacticaseibacillus nasuensis]|uniref:Type VII secretion system protein EssD-like domain-containing protein n=2 Tax=Lacticaseibacillus TaxID=2759736 RepID=A0A0R1JPD5_9LACO|nr:DNA/RNA non-specific endonuclease [Lacticaseibacillus nasuensis]KRK71011.1 hypothetical protein FD02_GL000195 [Lacticaseibacillus nasuensis JCM 17158]